MSIQPCLPDILPLDNIQWDILVQKIGMAGKAVARFDGTLDGMVNSAVLLSPITNNESVLSSKIEGTQASVTEVLQFESGEEFGLEKEKDINEILNYRHALLLAEDSIKERGITLSLIKELHQVLMNSVRGENKNPGEFRAHQNWIGEKNCKIGQARFIPPNPIKMIECLENLIAFINLDFKDPLVQLAVIHAQFEIIHPFSDGNGRLGRMLIPLFLYQKKELQRPIFYLSEYLEEHDEEYRDRLLAITCNNDWHGWIEFFLEAVYVQAQRNTEKAKKIHTLYEQMKIVFTEVTKSQYALVALDTFFNRPIISATKFSEEAGLNDKKTTANTILKSLHDHNIICRTRKGSGRRPSVYAMPELINIAEGKDIFIKI